MIPPRRPALRRRSAAPLDATQTARQGQGIGDIEAMTQMATTAIPEVLRTAPITSTPMSLLDAGVAAVKGDKMGTGLALAGALPMGGVIRKGAKAAKAVAPSLPDILQNMWHGTGSEAFPKFLREKFGRGGSGGNRLGIGGYQTEAQGEGIHYLDQALKEKGLRSGLVTGRGTRVALSAEDATRLRSGEVTLDDLIARQEQEVEAAMKRAANPTRAVFLQRAAANRADEARESLFGLLTARDQGVAEIVRPGALLNTRADVDPDYLLRYDKDLGDQPGPVQDALRSVLGIQGRIIPHSPNQQIKFSQTVNRLYEPEVTKRLEDAGVQGVLARSAIYGEPGSKPLNVSVFNPDRIAILRALGIAGMAGGGAAAMRGRPPQQQEM